MAKKKQQDENLAEDVELQAEQEQPKEKKTKSAKNSEAEKLTQELADTNDQLLRLAAEYDNFRKRSAKEKEELYTRIRADVVAEFLGVIDNFERAQAAPDAALEDYKKGMDMIFTQFRDILAKLGVAAFGEAGETFDPKLHNAVMHIEDESLPENSIAQVFSKGYKIGEQLVRPATVQAAN